MLLVIRQLCQIRNECIPCKMFLCLLIRMPCVVFRNVCARWIDCFAAKVRPLAEAETFSLSGNALATLMNLCFLLLSAMPSIWLYQPL